MANPGKNWNPPERSWNPPAAPRLRLPESTIPGLGLGLPAPIPPPPMLEIERICGLTHISLFNAREAAREYDAFLRGESYVYRTPETDAEGYLVNAVTWPR